MNRTHGLSVHSNEGIPEYATFDLLAAIRGVGTSYQVGTDHEMTSGRDLVSLECSADEMIQNGQSQMSFRDGAPKTGSLELWEVQSRSSMLRSGAARLFRLILPIRQQGPRSLVSRFRPRFKYTVTGFQALRFFLSARTVRCEALFA